jgi:hypothetical protein
MSIDKDLIRVNLLEVAAELAHKATLREFLEHNKSKTEADMYVKEQWQDEICEIYREEVQDVFNKWYEFYLDSIETHKIS